MSPVARRGAGRRAPRLAADERLAGRITRVGRFAKVDPRRGRALPGFAQLLAFTGWMVFMEESFRRAVRARRTAGTDQG